jgi:hypothetical protein
MRREVGCFILLVVLLVSVLVLSACKKKLEPINATIVPLKEKAVLHLRGYVTDDKAELVSRIYNFDRAFSHRDTVDGKPVFVYVSNGEKIPFSIGEDGSVHQLITVYVSELLFPFRITFTRPLLISYWETLLKQNDGVGTEWHVLVDTTLHGLDSTGKPVQIRYVYSAKAKNEGWKDVFIPRNYRLERTVDVHWYEVENFILNETTGDSLFVRKGTAHHYFDPELGIVKYITDYKKKEGRTPFVSLRGTWELIKTEFTE